MLWSSSSCLGDNVQGGACLTFKGELRSPIAAASVVLAGHRRRFSSVHPRHPPMAAPRVLSLSPDVHPCCHPLHPIATTTTNGSHANFQSLALLLFCKPKVNTVVHVSEGNCSHSLFSCHFTITLRSQTPLHCFFPCIIALF
jgi:hypothetical protein